MMRIVDGCRVGGEIDLGETRVELDGASEVLRVVVTAEIPGIRIEYGCVIPDGAGYKDGSGSYVISAEPRELLLLRSAIDECLRRWDMQVGSWGMFSEVEIEVDSGVDG